MSRLFGDLEGDDGLPRVVRRVAIIVIILGTSMTVLDGSIVNVTLPMIARSLDGDPAAAVWIVNAYILAGAMTMAAFASIGEVFGFRRFYIYVRAASWYLPWHRWATHYRHRWQF